MEAMSTGNQDGKPWGPQVPPYTPCASSVRPPAEQAQQVSASQAGLGRLSLTPASSFEYLSLFCFLP